MIFYSTMDKIDDKEGLKAEYCESIKLILTIKYNHSAKKVLYRINIKYSH